MNESHIRNVIEAALLAAGKSLQPAELVELFDEGARPQLQDIQAALAALNATGLPLSRADDGSAR